MMSDVLIASREIFASLNNIPINLQRDSAKIYYIFQSLQRISNIITILQVNNNHIFTGDLKCNHFL
jgi:hypothetical protein